jgi:hypothetical protein
MALLGAGSTGSARWGGRRGANLALAGAIVAAVTGCVVLQALGLRDKPLGFSHALHAKEGAACEECHVADANGRRLGLPVQAQCALCHAGIDEGKPPERRVDTLFVDGQYKAAAFTHLDDEVRFSHATHLDAGASCEQCHKGIEQNEQVDASLAVGMQACMDCHAAAGLDPSCSTCHTVLDKNARPQNHDQLWRQMHGKAVRGGLEGPANDCAMCHTEQSCNRCHADEKPASHNVFWRQRTHGFVAAMDRESCATCHKEDSCSSCHADTKPQSHIGLWGSTMDTHCLSCHVPLKAESCFVCHKSTPSHLDAPAKPDVPPHSPAMDCRSCHGVSVPLLHVDNGDDCNSCHH